MTRADLITILMNTELEGHRNLTREQARAVVREIFATIREALHNEGDVRLPFGNLSVHEQSRKPMRRWFLKRVRVTYAQRNRIKFQGDKYDVVPADQPPHPLDNKGEMKHSEIDSTPPKISPAERRKLVAIGIKARKSQRLIAQELNVTATTIRRDLEALGITAKKPTATIRKPAVVFKVASQNPTKPLKFARRIKGISPRPVFPRRVVPEPLKPRPPKPLSPEIALSPEQLRQQRLEEMLQLVGAWLLEWKPYHWRAINVLDKARIRLAASEDHYIRGLHESSMSAEQLRDVTRPPEMDSARGASRKEEVCAKWLARWLAAWAPQDKQLRKDLLDQTRAALPARLR